MSDWLRYLLLIIAGFLAGIVNTLAGGGSFLTLPALMFIYGLDPKLANGTNRVAILFSSAAASLTFHKHGHLDRRQALQLTLPTLCGVPVGALLAIYLPASTFRPLFGAIFLGMAIVLLLDPKRITSDQKPKQDVKSIYLFAVFFSIGIYVGFIQAGMGILLLLAMSLLHTGDLLASNAIKNLIGFLVTLAAMAVFAAYGLIEWLPGIVMAAGNIAGGFVGARLAILKGNKLIFWFLLLVMLATGIRLLFY
jgi:uncharacterized membrane protein YfcA